MMIWIDLNELERKITENEYTDQEGFSYFLAYAILGVLATGISKSFNLLTFIIMLLGLGITIWGSYSIYRANSSGDGQDFFKRYFALSWVIGFRLLLIVIIIAIPLSVVIAFLSSNYLDIIDLSSKTLFKEWITSLFSMVVLWVYYILLSKSFKRVALKKKIELSNDQ